MFSSVREIISVLPVSVSKGLRFTVSKMGFIHKSWDLKLLYGVVGQNYWWSNMFHGLMICCWRVQFPWHISMYVSDRGKTRQREIFFEPWVEILKNAEGKVANFFCIICKFPCPFVAVCLFAWSYDALLPFSFHYISLPPCTQWIRFLLLELSLDIQIAHTGMPSIFMFNASS